MFKCLSFGILHFIHFISYKSPFLKELSYFLLLFFFIIITLHLILIFQAS